MNEFHLLQSGALQLLSNSLNPTVGCKVITNQTAHKLSKNSFRLLRYNYSQFSVQSVKQSQLTNYLERKVKNRINVKLSEKKRSFNSKMKCALLRASTLTPSKSKWFSRTAGLLASGCV